MMFRRSPVGQCNGRLQLFLHGWGVATTDMHKVFLALSAASLTMSASISSASSQEQGQTALPVFSPPTDVPLLVERTTWRDLGDDELQHKHVYRIVFHQRPRGYEMVAQLLSTEIDAPEKLQYLVDMQLRNENHEPMSFLLSSEGIILAGDTNEQAKRGIREALEAASQRAKANRSPKEAARVITFLQQLENTTREARPDWPRALFVPQYDDYAAQGLVRVSASGDGTVDWDHSRASQVNGADLEQKEHCEFDPLKGYAVHCKRDTVIQVGDVVRTGWDSHRIWPEPQQQYTAADE